MRTTLRVIVSAAMLLIFSLTVLSQQTAKSIPNATSPDGVIGFLEFRPKDYGTQKHPLIIFLHGVGERGNGTSQVNMVAYNSLPNMLSRGASMRFTVGGQTSSFVVLSPQLSTAYSYWPPYYVKEMINYAKANLQIDPNRIYVTGLSLGGGGVWRAITDADHTFDAALAAAAPVCGTQEYSDADFCATVGDNHLPIWAFHSMDDATVYVGVTQHAQSLSLNCNVTPASKFTYYQSGNHSGAWVNAYDTGHITTVVNGGGNFTANPNLYEWFLSNTRSGAPSYTAPVTSAGAAQIVTLPLSVITLAGFGTGTNGATISSYSWTKTSGPAAGVINSPLSNTTLVTGLVQGVYVFTLTVTDNHGLTSSSTVTVTVNGLINQTPVSNAGADVTITLPTNSVSLDAGGSYDPDGSIVAYYWLQKSGPATYNIGDQTAAKTTLSNLAAGVYVFTLQVRDNAGMIGFSTKTITVNASGNQTPVSNAGADVTITLPTNSVSLDATASYDPDGSIVAYYWLQKSGPSTYNIGDQTAAKTTLSNLAAGVYVFTLQVRDNAGVIGFSSKTITVNASGNQTPVSNAGADVTITLPTNSVSLDASGSYDPDGSIVAYYWLQKSGPSTYNIGDQTAAKTTLSNLAAGVYVFTLQVRDNGGVIGFSTKTIIVIASGNQTPVSNAGADVTITLPTNSVSLDATSSYDPDGSLVAYYWVKSSGPSGYKIADPTAAKTTLSNLVTGIYIFILQVRDNSGNIGFSTKVITVNTTASWNQTPVSNPGGDITVTYPVSNISLDASGSYDPDGSIVAYYWQENSGPSTYKIADVTAAKTTISDLGPGIYIFVLQVRDNNGAIGFSTKMITVINPASEGARMMLDAGDQDGSVLRSLLKDSGTSIIPMVRPAKLTMYPNPVYASATIELYSAENSVKTINMYDVRGVLKAKYTWQTTVGNNIFSLKNIAALTNGMYLIDIRDTKGKLNGSLKFLKIK